MDLPPDLDDYHVELAGTLVLADEPGDDVRSLRTRYGFTQAWLADKVDLRRESLSRIESGHVNLSLTFVRAFAGVMTLARAARDEKALAEARGRAPELTRVRRVAAALDLDDDVATDVAEAAMASYDRKRQDVIQGLGEGTS